MEKLVRYNAQGELLDECNKSLWETLDRGFGGLPTQQEPKPDEVVVTRRVKAPFQRIATWDMKAESIQLVVEYILQHEMPYYLAYVAGINFFDFYQYRFEIDDVPYVESSNDEHIREGAAWAKRMTDFFPTYLKNCVSKGVRLRDRTAAWYNIAVSCESLKGCPKAQEDRFLCLPSLELHASDVDSTVSLLAVLDGHGGAQIASYAVAHLPFEMAAGMKAHPGDNEKALEYAFTMTDKLVVARSHVESWHNVGSTVVAAAIDAENIYIRWLGDSAAYIIYGDRVERLTRAHNCMDEDERQRVHAAGGTIAHVDGVQRVNGQLAITRAFGDTFHRPSITGVSDAVKVARTSEMFGVMLLSDGICDLYNPGQLWKMIENFVTENDSEEYGEMAEHMVRKSYEDNSGDNCTCVFGFLQHPKELWRQLQQDVSTTASSADERRSSADSSAEDS